jgi:hypothetical protein
MADARMPDHTRANQTMADSPSTTAAIAWQGRVLHTGNGRPRDLRHHDPGHRIGFAAAIGETGWVFSGAAGMNQADGSGG